MLIYLVFFITGLAGGVAYLGKDSEELRAFVAMSKAIIMQDTSVFDESEPPPIFGSADSAPEQPPATGGKNSAQYERNASFLDSIFGEMEAAPEPPRVRGRSDEGSSGGFVGRAFGTREDKSGTFMAPEIPDEEVEPDQSGAGVLPRDFTERGRQQTNVRRIRIGD
jgi:hypothetical protein